MKARLYGSRRPAPEYRAHKILSNQFSLATLTLTKLSVVEQDVSVTKSLGNNVQGLDVVGQDVGHGL